MQENLQLDESELGLAIGDYGAKGRGIYATKPFVQGQFLVEYTGDLIDLDEARQREATYNANPKVGSYVYYFHHRGRHWCIDATRHNGLGRLVNHSRRHPNCKTKVFMAAQDDDPRLILVAKEDIKPGEGINIQFVWRGWLTTKPNLSFFNLL